jgi:DNA-binding beta-propeller fold protein YncE
MMIDLTPWGGNGAHATSVAVHGGTLAAAIPQGDEDTAPGTVVFFNTYGTYLSEVTVGHLPDMVTFTPNGQYVLTANEGQPLDDYSFDPEGSVSIIDMRGGAGGVTQADVTTAGFQAFNAPAVIDPRIRIFGPGASVAQDLEPEYIAVSHDSKTAWVTLQENNALAIVDLKRREVTSLVALGFKNHMVPGSGLDPSDAGTIGIDNWPVLGMYLPDAIAAFFSRGSTYLVTANEGDVREYDAFEENVRIGSGSVVLDPAVFPNAATLKMNANLGRLTITNTMGDLDGDGDYDQLFAFGGRSFSVWTADGALVWDSGDDFERITAAAFPQHFNASNTNNTLDNRSDDKGPEPEGIAVAKLFGRDFVFVALERIGGVMVYEIADPAAPRFVQYINVRDFSAAANTAGAGDLGAEGLRVVESSASGSPLLIVSNEISGTLRVFEITQAK